MEHILYWLWLTGLFGTNSGRFIPLVERLGGIEKVYNSTSYPSLGIYSSDHLDKLNNKNLSWAKKTYNTCQSKNISIITYDDKNYPEILKNIFIPPAVLYTIGEIPKWDELLMISTVGTRNATEYGLRVASTLCTELAQMGITIVSGVAKGIDTKSIEGALNSGAYCIMISPCGLDINYPKINEKLREKVKNTGLIISEYPPGIETKSWHFKDRNRIIAGISKGTLIIEAPDKSGALITARSALEENRDVFVVPGHIDDKNSSGINNLLKDGAKPVFSADDILSEYPHYHSLLKPIKTEKASKNTDIITENSFYAVPDKQEPKKEEPEFEEITRDDTAGKILKYLTAQGESHIDTLIREMGIPANEFQTALFLLELEGNIKRMPGNILKRVK